MVLGKQRTAGCAFLLSCSFLICAGYDGDLDIQMSFEEDPLFIVLDECVREYINHRVASQSITLKAEHYALVTAGAGQVFYGDDVTLEATWANFYVQILQSLEYETEFMEYLSSESNKRLVLGVYASRREHEEANILGVFISCLLENQFHSARSYEEEHGAGSHLPPGQIKELDVFVKKYMEERVAGHRIMRRIEQIVAELDPRRKKDCPWAAYCTYTSLLCSSMSFHINRLLPFLLRCKGFRKSRGAWTCLYQERALTVSQRPEEKA
jgi:hypothetical protein